MSPFYHCHVREGRHVVCATTNGLDHSPVPTGAFGKPMDAIRYADMRNANVQPLRSLGSSGEDSGLVPPAGLESSPEQPRGSSPGLTAGA